MLPHKNINQNKNPTNSKPTHPKPHKPNTIKHTLHHKRYKIILQNTQQKAIWKNSYLLKRARPTGLTQRQSQYKHTKTKTSNSQNTNHIPTPPKQYNNKHTNNHNNHTPQYTIYKLKTKLAKLKTKPTPNHKKTYIPSPYNNHQANKQSKHKNTKITIRTTNETTKTSPSTNDP